MRIALIDSGWTVGGTLTMTANISRGLREQGGHEVSAVVSISPEIAAPYFDGAGSLAQITCPYDYMRSRALKRAFDRLPFLRPLGLLVDTALQPLKHLYGLRVARHLRKRRPDIVHLNNGIWAIAAVARLGIPIVYHLHGLVPRPLIKEYSVPFSKVAHFIAISECVRESYLAAGLDPQKVSVVSNFVAPTTGPALTRPEARRLIGMPEDVELITFVGRVVPWKGPREFIAAMAVVARRHNNTRFLLVGDANETPEYVEGLRQQIDAEGLRDRVTFIEHLSDMQAAYRASSVLIHASIEPEPFGMVIIEAMQAGTPVVAARSGGPLEIIEDGVSGLLVDPTDTAALAAAVIRLLDDAPLRQSIIAAAERRVADRFSMSRAVQGLSHCYEQVLASVRPRGKYQAGRRAPAAELTDQS